MDIVSRGNARYFGLIVSSSKINFKSGHERVRPHFQINKIDKHMKTVYIATGSFSF